MILDIRLVQKGMETFIRIYFEPNHGSFAYLYMNMSFPWSEDRHKKHCSRNIVHVEKGVSKLRWLGGEVAWKMVPDHVWAGLMSTWMPSKFLVVDPMQIVVLSSTSFGLSDSSFVVGHAWILVSPSPMLAQMWPPTFILPSGMRRLVFSLTISTSGALPCSIPIIGQVWTIMLPTLWSALEMLSRWWWWEGWWFMCRSCFCCQGPGRRRQHPAANSSASPPWRLTTCPALCAAPATATADLPPLPTYTPVLAPNTPLATTTPTYNTHTHISFQSNLCS